MIREDQKVMKPILFRIVLLMNDLFDSQIS